MGTFEIKKKPETTAAVCVLFLGIAQCTAGAIILYFTAGTCTFGWSLIQEGV